MKNLFLLLITLFTSINLFATENKYDFKDGDLIFHISKSKQSPLIQYATMSPYSHCGIIIERKSKLYVLEASNVVKLTPIDEFIDRGRFSHYIIKRYKGTLNKIKYSRYLGLPYDISFSFNNKKYYCSELIYEIYKKQFGIVLCDPKPIKDYCTFGLKKVMKKRGMNIEQYVVAPSDILNSELLETIKIGI